MRYLFLALLLMGCAKAEQDINKEFKPYFDAFVADAKDKGYDFSNSGISIKFGETDCENEVGNGEITYACTVVVPRKIIVNQEFWDTFQDTESRKSLLYHHFGHAFLLRFTHNDEMADAMPVSLMNENLMVPGQYFLDHIEDYLTELF